MISYRLKKQPQLKSTAVFTMFFKLFEFTAVAAFYFLL